MKTMDPSELLKQPQDVTENPYRYSAKDKADKQKMGFSTAEDEVQSVCVLVLIVMWRQKLGHTATLHYKKWKVRF